MLFTILVDFRGGTYTSQLEAADAFDALRLWSQRIREADLNAWKLGKIFTKLIAEEPPIPIEGLSNAWCTAILATGGHLLLLNIIATAK